MKTWQHWWVGGVLAGSIYHLIRDILQFLAVETWITTVFHKEAPANQSLLWHPMNTVVIESVLILITLAILKRKRFGWLGWSSVFLVLCTLIAFGIYWFVLAR